LPCCTNILHGPLNGGWTIDSRSCRSAPSCCERGLDGGKKIRGVKIYVAVDNYGIPLAIEVSPANRHDTKGIVPVLRTLAAGGFEGAALGDLGYFERSKEHFITFIAIAFISILSRRMRRLVAEELCA
jgi:Transposase DDE domain